jgi:hypothetical protein
MASEQYRKKAAEIAAAAKLARDPAKRAQLKALEASYRRLALQADKNATTDIVYQTPPPQRQRPVAQQQQQSQPKKNKPRP